MGLRLDDFRNKIRQRSQMSTMIFSSQVIDLIVDVFGELLDEYEHTLKDSLGKTTVK